MFVCLLICLRAEEPIQGKVLPGEVLCLSSQIRLFRSLVLELSALLFQMLFLLLYFFFFPIGMNTVLC